MSTWAGKGGLPRGTGELTLQGFAPPGTDSLENTQGPHHLKPAETHNLMPETDSLENTQGRQPEGLKVSEGGLLKGLKAPVL